MLERIKGVFGYKTFQSKKAKVDPEGSFSRMKAVNACFCFLHFQLFLSTASLSFPSTTTAACSSLVLISANIFNISPCTEMSSHQRVPPAFEMAQVTPALWLPAQEIYFIVLMVQKINARGSHRSIGTFSKDEWLDIRKGYYEHFSLKHDLKCFKNKFTLLKERYKEFKKLVEGNTGLGWDPTLKTVTASPEWWNYYIKTHPKAKRFRNEGCPEYEKLGIIFDDTISIKHLEDLKPRQPPPPPFEMAQVTSAQWLPAQETYFIDLMAEKVTARGGQIRIGTFSKVEWLDIRKSYCSHFFLKHDLKCFKNKFSLLKDRYKEFKKLMEGNTELGWDPILQTVSASPDWWNDYIKAHPKAKRFRSEGCPEYKQLRKIFGDAIANGNLACIGDNNFNSSDRENGSNEGIDESDPSNLVPPCSSQRPSQDRVSPEQEGGQSPSSIPSSHPSFTPLRHARTRSTEFFDSLKLLAEVSRRRFELSKKYTIGECMDVLDSMGAEVGVKAYMEAVERFRDRGWREIFLRFSDERRKQWLQRLDEQQ